MSADVGSLASMYGEHAAEIVEGERNGVPVLVWECICGAKGKGSGSMRQATNGWRKHVGLPQLPSKPRPRGADVQRWRL